jgi:hypothetical protein
MRGATVRRLRAVAVAVACGCLAYTVLARPGGGQSYGGGGSGGGSSGGDGDSGELLFFVFRLLFELCVAVPQVGIPLTIMVVVGVIVFGRRAKSRSSGNYDWDGPGARRPGRQPPPAGGPGRGSLQQRSGYRALTSLDPDFSGVLFEDFVYSLFAAAHRARHDGARLADLAPYVEPRVRDELARRAPVGTPVLAVVIGAMRLKSLLIDANQVFASVQIEANLMLGNGTLYVRESWQLHRAAGVRSRPRSDVRTFACPNCGAPFESTDSQRCRYCQQIVSNGRFDWSVSMALLHEASDRPAALTGTVPERGTDRPTIFDPAFAAAWSVFSRLDPAVTSETMGARLALIHRETTAAWNTQNLAPARGFVSDGLYDYLGYWTSAYRLSALRNIVEDARLVRWEPVKLVSDRFYDALTLRVFATGRDFTLDARGSVVGGDRSRNRDYSEYWTLIRGASVRGAPRADKACPNCGAELRIAMSGQCEYCKARVTSGNFDWVLSKIEQDDSYEG